MMGQSVYNMITDVTTLMTTLKLQEVAMPTVGIRELKSQASEIIRQVREDRVEYLVTLRGEPVATLSPVEGWELEAGQLRGAIATRASESPIDDQRARRRAIEAAGTFHSGVTDLSVEHDRYLAEAFAE